MAFVPGWVLMGLFLLPGGALHDEDAVILSSLVLIPKFRFFKSRRLSDLGEICCKSICPVHIPPFFWSIEQLLPSKIDKICPRPVGFSRRLPKPDRLLGNRLFLFGLVLLSNVGHWSTGPGIFQTTVATY